MTIMKKFRKRFRRAIRVLQLFLTCTSWGEYDVQDFDFVGENDDQVKSSTSVIVIDNYIYHIDPWVRLHSKTRLPHNDFEEALWKEEFAIEVPVQGDLPNPVLTVCLGFMDHELKTTKQIFYYSYTYQKSTWDRALVQTDFAMIASQNYPDDPIIDGLPATIWLECVESTLCIMMSLCRMKHRKCNITSPRRYPEYPDSAHSRHGDYEYGPVAIFAGPRRACLRMDLVLQHIQDDAASIIEMSYHGLRSRNRRRRIAGRNHRLLLQREVELADGNKNQSAISLVYYNVSNNATIAFKLPNSNHRKLRRSEKSSLLHCNIDHNPRVPAVDPKIIHCNSQVFKLQAVDHATNVAQGNQPSSSIRVVYVEKYDGNTNQSALRYPADTFKLTPVLYIWNSESRTSDVETTPTNRYDMMASVHQSYKIFANSRPNTEEHSRHGRNVCELASMDSVVRRYLLQCYNKPPSKTDTWFDRVYTEHYLRTEKEPDAPTDEIQDAPSVEEQVPFRRQMAKNIRSGFRRLRRWYSIRTFFIQRVLMAEVRRRVHRQNRQSQQRRDEFWQEQGEEMWEEAQEI